MEGETRATVEGLNTNLAAAGIPFKLAVVAPGEVRLLEKNARYMTNDQFRRLVENVKKDGGLSSVPFCIEDDKGLTCLSGNHRVEAARAAGLSQILVLYTDQAMSQQQRVAVQLSHNALVGQDDPVILRDLYNEITDLALKTYSGIDDKALGTLPKVSIEGLTEARLDFRTLTFLLLPNEAERVKEVFERARVGLAADIVHLGQLADFERLIDVLTKVRQSYDVHNSAVALCLVLDIFERHLEELAEGWWDEENDAVRHKGWVPLASVFGGDTIPPEAAKVIRHAVEAMVSREQVSAKARWQAIEMWAADYLAGE